MLQGKMTEVQEQLKWKVLQMLLLYILVKMMQGGLYRVEYECAL